MSNTFHLAYQNLNETEKSDFSRLVNKFHNETFVVKDKEPADFFFCLEQFELFESYFALIDYQFIKDTFNGLVYIQTSRDRNRIRLNKFDTALILILRKLYHSKKKEVTSSTRVLVSIEKIIEEFETAQVVKDCKKISYYEESLRKLRKSKIIAYSTSKIDAQSTIEILSPILIVIPQNDLEEIIKRLNALNKDGGNDNENIDED